MKAKIMSIAMMALLVIFSVSCGDDEDSPVEQETHETSSDSNKLDAEYENKLTGTSWKQVKRYWFSSYSNKYYEEKTSGIMTFASNHKWYVVGLFDIWDGTGTWKVENGLIDYDVTSNSAGKTNGEFRANLVANGFLLPEIISLTDNRLRVAWPKWIADLGEYTEFEKVSYTEPSGDSHDDNDNPSDNGEPPYVISFTSTANKNSITVKFLCDERPKSAIVKYGESTPSKSITASISGKTVIATANGLKAGTKYYFSCKVSNSYGSSTSDNYPVMTNYN